MVVYLISLNGCDDAIVNYTEITPGLIFTESYLNKDIPESNWLEVYNTSDQVMEISALRLSNYRAISVLTQEVVVDPGEIVILCADKGRFITHWIQAVRTIEVAALMSVNEHDDGGFIWLSTGDIYDPDDFEISGFQYGTNPVLTEGLEEYVGSHVLSFLDNGMSWSRYIVQTESGIGTTAYYQTTPSPGYINQK
ncbi:hypothetical protein ACFL4Q_00595 [candidate division KSB1 bacterium]